MNICIRKTLPYDPTFKSRYSKFVGYSYITNQKKDPDLVSSDIPLRSPMRHMDLVVTSMHKRAIQSAHILVQDTENFEQCHLCNEVLFDIRELVTQNEFDTYGSTIVRKRFLDAFENSTLAEPTEEILDRVEKLIRFIIIKSHEHQNLFIVSHSFFMKVFESYIRSKGQIKDDFKILRTYLYPQQKTYEFGMGFDCSLADQRVTVNTN